MNRFQILLDIIRNDFEVKLPLISASNHTIIRRAKKIRFGTTSAKHMVAFPEMRVSPTVVHRSRLFTL
jgi:hypothetical protein